jgi:hypothetical protein
VEKTGIHPPVDHQMASWAHPGPVWPVVPSARQDARIPTGYGVTKRALRPCLVVRCTKTRELNPPREFPCARGNPAPPWECSANIWMSRGREWKGMENLKWITIIIQQNIIDSLVFSYKKVISIPEYNYIIFPQKWEFCNQKIIHKFQGSIKNTQKNVRSNMNHIYPPNIRNSGIEKITKISRCQHTQMISIITTYHTHQLVWHTKSYK